MDSATRRVEGILSHVGLGVSPAAGGDPSTLAMHTMAKELRQASFPVRELTYLLDGSQKLTEFREEIQRELEADPALSCVPEVDMPRAEARKRTIEKVPRAWRFFAKDGADLDRRNLRVGLLSLYDPSWATRNGVHFGLFLGAISGLGTPEQQALWMPDVLTMGIFGCFGMTEMGHGSFVRGLETTATFVPGGGEEGEGEFEIHSPTLTATKWWIGAAGQTATHCSVYARLVVSGADHGIHCFIVQLRDMETHALMPGVTAGDCGAKMGRNGLDNGWIQFDHVRVPRSHMLMRCAEVTPGGVFRQLQSKEATYGALVGGRASMVGSSADVLKRAITIAVRYAAVRRQGEPRSDGLEPPILDYTTVQARLMPILATAYAFHFVAAEMTALYKLWLSKEDEGDMGLLKDVHATSAGLKAFCTWTAHDMLDTCRQVCGGHGYSAYNVLCGMHADFAVMCTWEGDNTVMALQTARYLLSSLRNARNGEALSGSVDYLLEDHKATCPTTCRDDLLRPEVQLAAMRFLANHVVMHEAEQLSALEASGKSDVDAWNVRAVPLVECSRIHVDFNVLHFFVSSVRTADDSVKAPLKLLCDLFAVTTLQKNLAWFLRLGYMTATHADWLEAATVGLNKALREQAVCLVDAFGFSDFVVQAPIGRRDGNVYPHLFERVRSAPGAVGPTPYFESSIKPILEGECVRVWRAG